MHKLISTLCLLFGLALFSAAWAQDDQLIYELDPGTLGGAFFVTDPAKDDLSVQLLIRSGEGDLSGVEGMAHYLEHLVWLSVAQEFPLAKEAGSNAFTSAFVTGYSLNVPADRFSIALKTLLAVFDTPSLDPEFMEEEIGIIVQEYETRTDGTEVEKTYRDAGRWLNTLPGEALPQLGGRSVLGVPADFETFTPEQAAILHAQTHLRDKAILLIRGGTNPEKIQKILSAAVGSGGQFVAMSPPRSELGPLDTKRFTSPDDRQRGEVLSIVRKVNLPRLENDEAFERRIQTAILLGNILSGTRDESLATPLYYDEFLVAGISVRVNLDGRNMASLSLSTEPEPGVAYEDIEPRLREVAMERAALGFSQDTLDRTRDKILRDRRNQIETDQAYSMIYSAIRARRAPKTVEFRNLAMEAVTVEDLKDLLTALTGPAREYVVEVRKQETEKETETEEAGS